MSQSDVIAFVRYLNQNPAARESLRHASTDEIVQAAVAAGFNVTASDISAYEQKPVVDGVTGLAWGAEA